MKKSHELKAERAAKYKALTDLTNKASAENRNFDDTEKTQFDALSDEIEELDKDIERAERAEDIQKKSAASFIPKDNLGDQEEKVTKRLSMTKMVRELASRTGVTGLELEMTQEAAREAKEAGVSNFTGEASLPAFFITGKRAVVAKGNKTTPAGGVLVDTDLMDYIETLRPATALEALGARMMTGLVGDVDLRKSTSSVAAVWGTESSDTVEGSKGFDTVAMSPKRLTCDMAITKTLLAQASLDVNEIVLQDMRDAIAQAVDTAGISGATGGNNPVGILNFAGLQALYAGNAAAAGTNADGAALVYKDIINLETAIALTNKSNVKMGYLINTQTRGFLKTLKKDAGSGIFTWMGGATPLNEYQTAVTNLVPANLTKGSGTGLSALIFGDFNDLVIGNWAGIDLVVDPYGVNAKKSQVGLIIASWWDIKPRREASFAAIKDAIVA